MKITSKLIAICLLLGTENAVKATDLSSAAIAEIMSFNSVEMKDGEDILDTKTEAKVADAKKNEVKDKEASDAKAAADKAAADKAEQAAEAEAAMKAAESAPAPEVVPPVPTGPTGPDVTVKPPKPETPPAHPTPVPAEADEPGAVVVEEIKPDVSSDDDINKAPAEDVKAPGQEEFEAKPQNNGDAKKLKPKTVVVQEPDGTEVVTVPSVGIDPVTVEKAEPVVLKDDVDLSDDSLQAQLNVQNNVKALENQKIQDSKEITKQAAVATAGDIAGIHDENENFKSAMTLYHWKMFDQDTQLQMYKDSVYNGNDLEDKVERAKVTIKLTEEETQKVQATLAKKIDEIKKLASQVIELVDPASLEDQEASALSDLQNKGYHNE